jgi:PAS domain-containing protein
VRLLTNPIIMRMGLGLLISMAVFAAGILALRALRREMVEDASLPEDLGSTDDATFAYTAVIQNLKQQKFELQNQHETQRRRAKTSEHITAAVIANLPCGVLFFAPNGLVKQANAAARQLLGFASPLGMSSDDLFRDNTVVADSGEHSRVADVVKTSLREAQRATWQISYNAPSLEHRTLNLTLIPVAVPPDEVSGLACVIADESPIAQLRLDGLLRAEISAEMALQLRTSLSIIRDCAGRIGAADKNHSEHLATDIAAETDRLDKLVGGFLAEYLGTKAAAASA